MLIDWAYDGVFAEVFKYFYCLLCTSLYAEP